MVRASPLPSAGVWKGADDDDDDADAAPAAPAPGDDAEAESPSSRCLASPSCG